MPILPACPYCASARHVMAMRGGFSCTKCMQAWPYAAPPPDVVPREVERVEGKVLGFRAWALAGGLLASINDCFGGWHIGVNKAECKAGAPHKAPAHDCECGLYAVHSPQVISPLMYSPDSAVGAVLAWGRIEVHPEGFRAQYAEVVMLAYDDEQPYGLVTRVQALASEMDVECVLISELEEKAARFGRPVDPELRPALGYLAAPYPIPAPAFGLVGASAGLPSRSMPVATAAPAFSSGGMVMLPSPPAPRPRGRPWKAVTIANGTAAAVNLVSFGLWAHWWSLAAGCGSAAIAAFYARRGWRARRR